MSYFYSVHFIEIQIGHCFEKRKLISEEKKNVKKYIYIYLKALLKNSLCDWNLWVKDKCFFFFTFAVIILFHLPCLSDSSLAQNHSPMFSGVSPSVSFKALRYKCSLTSLNFVFFYNLCNICDLAINACSWCIYLHKKFSVDWIWGDTANCWNFMVYH